MPINETIEDFLLVMFYVSTLTPLLLYLVITNPDLSLPYLILWALSTTTDAYTTYKFYRENPKEFQKKERNPILKILVKKLGFKTSIAIFTLLFEIITATLTATLLLPKIKLYLTGEQDKNPIINIPTALAIYGVSHIHAALKNTKLKTNPVIPPQQSSR